MTQDMAGKIVKGIYSAAMTCLGTLSTVLHGNESISSLDSAQWVTIATFTLGAFGGTFGLASWPGPQRLNGNGKPPAE